MNSDGIRPDPHSPDSLRRDSRVRTLNRPGARTNHEPDASPNEEPATSPRSASMRQAARFALWIQVIGSIAVVFALAANAYVWWSPERIDQMLAPRLGIASRTNIDATVQFAGFMLALLPLGIGLYALTQVGRLCRALRAASTFSDALSAALRRLALALMALAGCEVLVQSAQSVVLTYLNPPGQRALTIGVSTDFLLHVVIALLLLALAAVLREAARIADEHRQFV